MIVEHYHLFCKFTKSNEVSFELHPLNKEATTALKTPNRLVYVVRNGSDFLYVGEAKKELKTRLSRGFAAYRSYKRTNVKRNGYGGYKWIDLFTRDKEKTTKLDKLSLTAVVFDDSFVDKRDYVEAVEGELVHLIRAQTEKWPLFQNEIHFNNNFEDAHILAMKIFALVAREIHAP